MEQRTILINNNIASFLFSLCLAFISLIIYGAGEPGLIRNFAPYAAIMIVPLLLLAYFVFGYFVLKDTKSLFYNFISVSFISALVCVVFILSKLKFCSMFMVFLLLHPFALFEPEGIWEGVFSIKFLLILFSPSLLLWMGLGFKSNKKLFITLLLILLSVLIIPIVLNFYDQNRESKLTEYQEITKVSVDEKIPIRNYEKIFGLRYGESKDNYDWSSIETIVFIKDMPAEKQFEAAMGIQLPAIDFARDYYVVSRGERYSWDNGNFVFEETLANNTLVVYKVNIVKPLFSW